tara:strand:- start:217 stop:957 length:741 start_codon:yes stop_codon:yes gene_type:complete
MSKISVTTIAGLTSGGDANTVKIESGDDFVVDTNVLKVDASNNRVGVGTASPSSDLHVSGGAGANVAIQSSAGSHWRLGDAVGSSNGIFVIRDHTNSANRVQILADGKTQIAQGITFGSDTAAANTLDDYEEGTWTATAGSGAGTLSSAAGVYTKIGRVVYVAAYLAYTGAATGSNRTYGGLPFPVLDHTAASSVDFQGLAWSNQSAGYLYFEGGTSNFVNNHQKTFQGSFTANDFTRIQGFYFTT